MKVKTLLKALKKYEEEYDDFLEWEVYTEQCGLVVPTNYRTIEEEKDILEKNYQEHNIPVNMDWINELEQSKKEIDKMKSMGWKFITDSDGWVYKECAINSNEGEEESFHTIFEKDKIFTINNNY